MRMNVSLEKPNGKGGFAHAGAVTSEFESIGKEFFPPRGGWKFTAPANLGIQVGWRIRLKAGKPWFVASIIALGDGTAEITLTGG